MKLQFEKNGKLKLASQGAIKPQWTTAWDGDCELAPDRGSKVQAIRFAEKTRRPLNPLFLLDWLSRVGNDFTHQFSHFLALGRTSAAHKESVRKNFTCGMTSLLVLLLLWLSLTNSQQTQKFDGLVKPESAIEANNGSAVIEAGEDQADSEQTAAGEEMEDEPQTTNEQLSEIEPVKSTFGQAPFILPAPAESKVEKKQPATQPK